MRPLLTRRTKDMIYGSLYSHQGCPTEYRERSGTGNNSELDDRKRQTVGPLWMEIPLLLLHRLFLSTYIATRCCIIRHRDLNWLRGKSYSAPLPYQNGVIAPGHLVYCALSPFITTLLFVRRALSFFEPGTFLMAVFWTSSLWSHFVGRWWKNYERKLYTIFYIYINKNKNITIVCLTFINIFNFTSK